MTITEAITALPQGKPEVVAGQIHDDEDDVIMVRLNGTKLFVEANDGKHVGVLDPADQLGNCFTVQIVASPGLFASPTTASRPSGSSATAIRSASRWFSRFPLQGLRLLTRSYWRSLVLFQPERVHRRN